MLQPKRTKYRKAHKGRIKGEATSDDAGTTFAEASGRSRLRAVP